MPNIEITFPGGDTAADDGLGLAQYLIANDRSSLPCDLHGPFGTVEDAGIALHLWLTKPGRDIQDVLDMNTGDIVPNEYRDLARGRIGRTMIGRSLEHLLRRSGIDARAYAVLMLWERRNLTVGGARLDATMERRRRHAEPKTYGILLEEPFTFRTEVTLPRGTTWTPEIGVISLKEMIPETLMTDMIGRPLSEVITHPLLDCFDATIDDAFNEAGGTVIYHTREAARVALDDVSPL